jgi:hypothetical protein
MRRVTVVIARTLTVALLAALAGPAPAQQPPPKVNLVFSAGPTGGTWTPMAAATAEVIKRKFPELDVQVEPGAALVNMEKIRSDKADLGWSMTTVLSDARAGANTWKGKQTDKVYSPALLFDGPWAEIARAVATGTIGVIALAAALEGYLLRAASWLERGLFMVAAFLLIDPGLYTDLAGLVALGAGLASQKLRRGTVAVAPVR